MDARTRILLIEDDQDDYVLARDLFEEIGPGRFDLEWIADYDRAVEAIERNAHDVYLLDYRLGEHSGLDLLRLAIGKGCRVPMIVLTGQADRSVDQEAMESGAADYLVKSQINADLMERSIRYAMARLHAERRMRELESQRTEAERVSKFKSQFLANMSHELRTPLNAIIGFSELLLESTYGDLNEKQRRQTTNILKSGKHLLQLINDILDLSKIEAGRLDPQYASFDVTTSLNEVYNIVKTLANQKHLSLTIQTASSDGPLPPVTTDERMFKQVVYNLLSNAIKFTPDGGSVIVDAFLEAVVPTATRLRVSVTDTGVGIDQKDHERVFVEFEQLDNSYSREQQGTGLGLALARKLVRLLGGDIEVQSEINKGSTFSFFVPLLRVSPPSPDTIHTPIDTLRNTEVRRGRPLVLVVEDDRPASELLCSYLTDGGYDVARAFNANEALNLLRALKLDAMTLDVMLPGKDGWQLFQELRKELGIVVPTVMVSVFEDKGVGFGLGLSDWLVKPVSKVELLNAMEKSTGGRGVQIALVVDDDPVAVEFVAETLKSQDARVLQAYAGGEAIRLASQYRPDLIILDLVMPEVDGFQVIDRLRESPITCDIPVLVYTAKDLTTEDRERLNNRHLRSITKKQSKTDLLSELARLLRKPAGIVLDGSSGDKG
jgi:signal transduction histidine kinase